MSRDRLVPCRWSHTGWKYVEEEPNSSRFFTNPNRVNGSGWMSPINEAHKA